MHGSDQAQGLIRQSCRPARIYIQPFSSLFSLSPCFFLSHLSWSLPFLAFDPSPKHPIRCFTHSHNSFRTSREFCTVPPTAHNESVALQAIILSVCRAFWGQIFFVCLSCGTMGWSCAFDSPRDSQFGVTFSISRSSPPRVFTFTVIALSSNRRGPHTPKKVIVLVNHTFEECVCLGGLNFLGLLMKIDLERRVTNWVM